MGDIQSAGLRFSRRQIQVTSLEALKIIMLRGIRQTKDYIPPDSTCMKFLEKGKF